MMKTIAGNHGLLTGWANVSIFTRNQTFATMLTGNTLWMAQAFVEGQTSKVLNYLTVIFSYLCGVTAFRQLDISPWKQKTMPLCAALVTVLFSAANTLGGCWNPMLLLAFGFGIINLVGQEVTGT